MSIFDKMGRALQIALGVGFLAAFASLNGCVSAEDPAGDSAQLEDEPAHEAAAGLGIIGAYQCVMIVNEVPATLLVYEDGTCQRLPLRLIGASAEYCDERCPTCASLAHDELDCRSHR